MWVTPYVICQAISLPAVTIKIYWNILSTSVLDCKWYMSNSIYHSRPPRWRRGSGLDCGSGDPGSIPSIPSPRVDHTKRRIFWNILSTSVLDCKWYTKCISNFIYHSRPSPWRRGSGLDCGLGDPGSFPSQPSPRVDPTIRKTSKTSSDAQARVGICSACEIGMWKMFSFRKIQYL